MSNKRIILFQAFMMVSSMVFAQGRGAYQDAMNEEKSGSGGDIFLGIIIIIAILYFTQDKNKN